MEESEKKSDSKKEELFEHKCICCGYIKERAKIGSCPQCGYKMLPTPYDRKDALIGEIKTFIKKLEVSEVKSHNLIYKGKDKDDKRFPTFDKIQSYICSAEKTEMFFQRLNQSIEQVKTYVHEEFAKQYKVDYSNFGNHVKQMDTVLVKAMQQLGYVTEYEFDKVEWPALTLDYKEIPNQDLIEVVCEVIELLEKISDKLKKFIKVNNIYGKAHTKKPKDTFKKKKDKEGKEIEPDYYEELQKCIQYMQKILDKKYVIDIFDDGTEELEEILTAIWNPFAMIMRSPILIKQSVYILEDGSKVEEQEAKNFIVEKIAERYVKINEDLLADDYLKDKSVDDIFVLYNKLIDIDDYGFIGVSATGIMHVGESEKQLKELIGLDSVKDNILKIKAYAVANKGSDALNVHMCFYGNPGTGKTEVARIIAGILYENKILPSKKVVEVDRSGLVGQYLGETPLKTMAKIEEAMGGVLFVDEAYALANSDDRGYDYGHEAVATLIKAMEDYRGKFCVILAGYKNQMDDMIATNPGFKSRIQFEVDFPNYSRPELGEITDLMLTKRKYTLNEEAREKILDITDVKRKEPNFANAREIRNILDQVIMCQNVRAMGTDDKEIGIVDVNKYIQDSGISLPTTGEGRNKKIMTGEDELDALIGLASVKRMVKKIKAFAKRNKDEANFNMHMCFYGNPGTGKTEVARIMSRILFESGVLAEAKLVETDARGLIGKFVGETAPKTEAKIKDAMGGVLFIDEAYSLSDGLGADGKSTSYGDEAIATLLKEMEDKRGKFCVVLAGYKEEMQNMLSVNPGFESRIQFTLDFPDYTREELAEIATVFLEKKKYSIKNDALERVLDVTEWYRERPNFANARTIRNILDQVIMNQNLRVDESDGEVDEYLIIKDDVEDYIMDEGIMKDDGKNIKIGFV